MEIRPFRALRFNKAVVGNTGQCISPPYDVIDADQQEQLYATNQYNVVRIIRGRKNASDNESENEYTRAADYLDNWIKAGALKQDESETIYGYVQDFEINGQTFHRLSFIALAKLEEFGKIVRPHEQILKKPMQDRLNLQKATKATFGLVFMIYDDRDGAAEKAIAKAATKEPLVELLDEQQVLHRLFAINDKNDIASISGMMSRKSCIIADGHHRYTTGLTYMKENPDNAAAKYQMICFANSCHEGLIVLATHRAVKNLGDFNSESLITGLKKNFDVTEYGYASAGNKEEAMDKMLKHLKAEYKNNRNAFGIHAANKSFHVAVLKNAEAMDPAAPGMSKAWKSLDVSILHKLILEDILGIDDEKLAAGGFIEYIKDSGSKVEEMTGEVDCGQKQAALFMNPPRIEQIQAVADQGERMPQKSTYFYPKMFSGLTINKL